MAPTLSEATYRRIAALMQDAAGLSFGDARQPLVSSRLAPRIQRLGLAGFDEYVALLEGPDDGGEFQMAVDLLTTNETYFFREPQHFDLLQAELQRERPRRLAVWSAACSFGDEAYSLAMLLAELEQRGVVGADWAILASDISDRVLRAAVAGIVPQERLRHVTPERLRRWCLRGEGDDEGKAMLLPELRRRVAFAQVNLTRPIDTLGAFERFDAIFLRNVLIYFDAATKAEVVDRVLARLRPGGLFFIGIAEGRVACRTPLEPVAPGAFRKPAQAQRAAA